MLPLELLEIRRIRTRTLSSRSKNNFYLISTFINAIFEIIPETCPAQDSGNVVLTLRLAAADAVSISLEESTTVRHRLAAYQIFSLESTSYVH